MTDINTLYGHVEDLHKRNLHNILTGLIEYGENGNTPVTPTPSVNTDLLIYLKNRDSFSISDEVSYNPYLFGSNIVIDWGDGTTTDYTGSSEWDVDYGELSHTYSSEGDYVIRISNVTGLNEDCFKWRSVDRIVIPPTVTTISDGSIFIGENYKIEFLATSSDDILTFDEDWGISEFYTIIPDGTTALYVAKGYPSEYLIEKTDYEALQGE